MPARAEIEDIEQELGNLGVTVRDDDILIKFVELCTVYRQSAEEMVSEWIAFTSTKQCGMEPNLELVNQFEKEELNKMVSKTPKSSRTSSRVAPSYNASTIDNLDAFIPDAMLQDYGTPNNQKKRQLTPENISSKRSSSQGKSPGLPFSPASFSHSLTTPSAKYGSRTSSGDVVCHFQSSNDLTWKGASNSGYKVNYYDPSSALTHQYHYMFEKLRDKAIVFNEIIEMLADGLQQHLQIEEWSPIHLPQPEEITVVGRICCDGNGKINASSLLLEGSHRTSSGRTVSLDISELQQFSFFPGQIIAARGINSQGKKLILKHLYEGVLLNFPAVAPAFIDETEKIQLVIAVGPFTTSDTLSYEPLEDLIRYLQQHKPHFCILIGPFVDSKHEIIAKGNISETYEDIFQHKVDTISRSLESCGTKLIIIPSLRDIHHDFVYPIPPFPLKKTYQNVFLASDPSILDINGIVVAVTSTDILFHLGKEEINFNSSGSSDRLGRLAKHILMQHSFYPLYPYNEEMNVDTESLITHAQLPVTPHILILPSDLRYFIKAIDGCCCINPEHLTKGLVGGTFARIEIRPFSKDTYTGSLLQHLTAEIVKI